jgi:hypothetical protein
MAQDLPSSFAALKASSIFGVSGSPRRDRMTTDHAAIGFWTGWCIRISIVTGCAHRSATWSIAKHDVVALTERQMPNRRTAIRPRCMNGSSPSPLRASNPSPMFANGAA